MDKIAAFNRTAREFPDQVTLHELIEARAQKHPSQHALICDHDKYWGTSTLNYEQLNERANQVAHLLRSQGVQPGQIIGIMVERSFAMIIGIFGILKAGAAYLPLSPDDPPKRLRYMLDNAGVKTLLDPCRHGCQRRPQTWRLLILNSHKRTLARFQIHSR